MQIVPAIIPQSFHDLQSKIDEVKDFAQTVQIDVLDGLYTPSKSWPYRTKDDPDFEKVKSGSEGLPGWQDLEFEIDLMIQNPEDSWRDWIQAGASRIIIHLESTEKIRDIIDSFKEENISDNSFLYSQLGLAIKPATPVDELYPYLEEVDFIQLMGSDNIGHHGEVFDISVIDKIKDIKNRNPQMSISIDIGMNEKTITQVKEAGADKVAVGSALFESENLKKEYEHLSNL